MKRSWTPGAMAFALLGVAAACQTPRRTPPNLYVDVLVTPSYRIIAPGDASDAVQAETCVVDAHTMKTLGCGKVVVVPGKIKKARFTAGDLSVEYTVDLGLERASAMTQVRVLHGKDIVYGSRSAIVFAPPGKGVQPAPAK
jgi:hypothetical protein